MQTVWTFYEIVKVCGQTLVWYYKAVLLMTISLQWASVLQLLSAVGDSLAAQSELPISPWYTSPNHAIDFSCLQSEETSDLSNAFPAINWPSCC